MSLGNTTLKIDVTHNLHKLKKFGEKIPNVFVSYLSNIAKHGRNLLRKDLLSGKALNLKGDTTDKIGRNLVNGRVIRDFNITFASYPVNLFERGRTLRNGSSEAGKYIITREFKTLLNTRLQGFADHALEKTIKKEIKKI